jgi:hypothetical protein
MFQEINQKPLPKNTSLPDQRIPSDHIASQGASPTTTPSADQSVPPEVIARYYRGVGSRQDNNAADRMWFGFNGKDEERIRNAAFAGLYCDYRNSNDSIYIIGFSRGAASARLLARDICIKGFPPKLEVHTTRFPNLLTGQIEPRVDGVKRLDQKGNQPNHRPKIAFLGCWDTVDAFVLPSRFPKEGLRNKIADKTVRALKSSIPRLFGYERFRKDEKVNENEIPDGVERAVHCVAIDETRDAFLPTLMPYKPHIEEVWFPGVHADVGGGYDDNLLAEGPYEFMKNRLLVAAKAHGANVEILFKKTERTKFVPDYCFHFHGFNTGLDRAKDLLGFGTSIRRIRVEKGTVRPKIHSSIYKVVNGDSVFAADHLNRRKWTVTYDPYNVAELKGQFDIVYDGTTEPT